MRFADLMADFFSRQPDERGYYPLSGAPPGSAAAALNIEELALFSVIDLISSVGAMCEWRFYNNRQRVEQEDWYTWNFSPNPDQDGAEFKRLLLARELIALGTPVTQACYECGFGDYSAFSRAYRKQFGQPPSTCK